MKKDRSHIPVEKTAENERVSSSVPPAVLQENKLTQVHNRSHAAHLEDGRGDTHSKPTGDMRFNAPFPSGRKQP
jgi:hypothetical protein